MAHGRVELTRLYAFKGDDGRLMLRGRLGLANLIGTPVETDDPERLAWNIQIEQTKPGRTWGDSNREAGRLRQAWLEKRPAE